MTQAGEELRERVSGAASAAAAAPNIAKPSPSCACAPPLGAPPPPPCQRARTRHLVLLRSERRRSARSSSSASSLNRDRQRRHRGAHADAVVVRRAFHRQGCRRLSGAWSQLHDPDISYAAHAFEFGARAGLAPLFVRVRTARRRRAAARSSAHAVDRTLSDGSSRDRARRGVHHPSAVGRLRPDLARQSAADAARATRTSSWRAANLPVCTRARSPGSAALALRRRAALHARRLVWTGGCGSSPSRRRGGPSRCSSASAGSPIIGTTGPTSPPARASATSRRTLKADAAVGRRRDAARRASRRRRCLEAPARHAVAAV